jgi:UDP-N-acetylmuramoyl-L-alanyl-D-glutamate--2,6-diaminopimelate ligase
MAEIPRPRRPTPRSIQALAHAVGANHHGPDVSVTGLALHTGLVQPGDLFAALPGANRHGIEFWPAAAEAGATAVLTDSEGADSLPEGTPQVVIEAPRARLGEIAAEIYGTGDIGSMMIAAVTGTNGKTSTAFLLDALMRGLGWTTALSTTAERAVAGVPYKSTLTTPEAPDIHAMLALAKEQGVSGLAIEVSAQALDKNRLDRVMADVAGFTNLSHDHFEDFGNMDNYLAAKAALFTPERAKKAVICVDTRWGLALAQGASIPFWTLGAEQSEGLDTAPHWRYSITATAGDTTTFSLSSPEGEAIELLAPILGEHMVANAALAAVMLILHGVDPADLEAAMGPGTTGIPVFVPGRIERVSGPTGPQVFVDAGRSEDAYRATLETVRSRTKGRLVMVCGTSGNRDPSKRPLMGATAAKLADVVIVTDDDPRREDPAVIRAGLLEGVRSVEGATWFEIPDPSEAIRHAISMVGEGDSVLWSGPGSQNYRDIGGEKVPYSARDEARAALSEAGFDPEQPRG